MISYLRNKVENFWNAGHERTLKIKRNFIYSFAIKGASVAIGFLLIPLTINYINTVQYGIWLTITSLVAWINNFDIGLANGLRNKIAHSMALNEEKKVIKYISTTYAIIFLIASGFFLIFFLGGSFLNWNSLLNTNGIGFSLWPIVAITLASFCVQFALQPINSVLTAMHRPFMSSLILLFSTTLKKYRPWFRSIDMSSAKSLLNMGGGFFFLQMGAMILYQTDNIVLTRIVGPGAVTTFNIAFKYFYVVNMLFAIILTP